MAATAATLQYSVTHSGRCHPTKIQILSVSKSLSTTVILRL